MKVLKKMKGFKKKCKEMKVVSPPGYYRKDKKKDALDKK
jgi:hypothetical protein